MHTLRLPVEGLDHPTFDAAEARDDLVVPEGDPDLDAIAPQD